MIGLSALRHLLWFSLNVMTILRLVLMKSQENMVMFSLTQSVKPPWQSFVFNHMLLFFCKATAGGGKKREDPTGCSPTAAPLLRVAACEMVLDHSRTRSSDVVQPQLLLSC